MSTTGSDENAQPTEPEDEASAEETPEETEPTTSTESSDPVAPDKKEWM